VNSPSLSGSSNSVNKTKSQRIEKSGFPQAISAVVVIIVVVVVIIIGQRRYAVDE
jgi:hypothetical protein